MKYFRIFGHNDREPTEADLLEWARNCDPEAKTRFRTDDRGWFEAEFALPELEERWHINRFLSDEEGIRRELATWAAWLEAQETNPYHVPLMNRMIGTRQVLTIEHSEAEDIGAAAKRIASFCRRLCQMMDGVYQIDGHGFFAADGTLLVEEHDE